MKTIKELAEELDVSKQTIRNIIAKLGLQSSLQKIGNRFVINAKQEDMIISEFEGSNANQNENQNAKEFTNQFANKFAFDFAILEDELDEKNEQLKEKDKQISELHKLLDQQQKLMLQNQNMLKETQLKLEDMEKNIEEEEIKENPKRWWKFWK